MRMALYYDNERTIGSGLWLVVLFHELGNSRRGKCIRLSMMYTDFDMLSRSSK